MRHKFLVLTVKKWLKSVYIYGSYRKIKTGVPLFLDHSVFDAMFALCSHLRGLQPPSVSFDADKVGVNLCLPIFAQ